MAEIARRQWNVLDLDDLRACGLTRQAVAKRVDAGRLFPKYRGVFALADGRFPEVTAKNPRAHKGIFTHRSTRIERTFLKGIPVTPLAE